MKDNNSKFHADLKQYLATHYDFRYNVPFNRYEFRRLSATEFKELSIQDIWEDVNSTCRVTKDYLTTTITASRVSRHVNPLKDWLEGLKWDGRGDPIKELCGYIALENDSLEDREWLYLVLKKWFVGAVKTLYDKRYVHKQTVVFQGRQGIGKSPFCKRIIPEELWEFVQESSCLDMDNKDSVISLTSSFVIVLDEINDFLKEAKNRKKYKSYMTTERVKVRLPFGRQEVSRVRIASMLATCNESLFLHDETDTQRFAIFVVDRFFNRDVRPSDCVENFNMASIWAQAFKLLKSGFNPRYTRAEQQQNERRNERFKYNSPEFDVLRQYFVPANKDDVGATFMTTTEICAYLNRHELDFKFYNVPMGKALVRQGFGRVSKKIHGRPVYGYFVRFLKEEQLGTPITPKIVPLDPPNPSPFKF